MRGGAGAIRWGGGVAAGAAGFGGAGTVFGGAAGGVTTEWAGDLGLAAVGGEVAGNTAPQKPQNLLPAGISLRQFEHTVGAAAC